MIFLHFYKSKSLEMARSIEVIEVSCPNAFNEPLVIADPHLVIFLSLSFDNVNNNEKCKKMCSFIGVYKSFSPEVGIKRHMIYSLCVFFSFSLEKNKFSTLFMQ